MSFQAMTWAVAQPLPAMQKLVLLMLANFCNHHTGQCNPRIKTLAAECGMSETACKNAIKALADEGLLQIEIRSTEGVQLPNTYILNLHVSIAKTEGVGRQTPGGGSPNAWGVGRQTPAREPTSLNQELNLDTSSAELTTIPTVPCPYQEIVNRYHQHLPDLPAVRLMEGKTWIKRQKAMRELWGFVLRSRKSDGTRRATNSQEALAWFDTYFERAKSNDFLMGRTKPGNGHENWRADFDFLLSEKGMRQVIEKTETAA